MSRRTYLTAVHFAKPIEGYPDEVDSLCGKGGTNPTTTTSWDMVDCKYCLRIGSKKARLDRIAGLFSQMLKVSSSGPKKQWKEYTFESYYGTHGASGDHDYVTISVRQTDDKLMQEVASLQIIPLMIAPPDDGPHLISDPKNAKVWDVMVHPDYRRKGLATAMYDFAEHVTGKKLVGGDFQTPDGQAFRRKRDHS